ncbi:hypothetical protein Plhal304r1_c015g0054741 [Plasmopara halstedii]
MVNKDDKQPTDEATDFGSKQLKKVSQQARVADEGLNHHARNTFRIEVDYIKELTKSSRQAIDEMTQWVGGASKTLTSPIVEIFKRADGEEGTRLRKYYGVARRIVNAQFYATQMQLQESKRIAQDQLVPLKGVAVAFQERLIKVNELRREQPAMTAASLVIAVAFPSLILRGKWAAIRNSVVAVGVSAAVSYGSEKRADKKGK